MNMAELPVLTRRVFLNRTLQALGSVAAAAVPLSAWAGDGPAPGAATTPTSPAEIPTLEFLSRTEYLALDAVGDTLIPQGGVFELGAREAGLTRRIDHYLTKMDPVIATGFRGAIAFVEQQAPGLAAKPAPFSALSEGDRAAVFDAMLAAGGLPSGILMALKYICMGHFYTMDRTWKITGYDGPMLPEGTP